MKITLEEAKIIYNTEPNKEEITAKQFKKMIPTECRKCGLLEKDNYHKTLKCLYRSKEGCMLKETNRS